MLDDGEANDGESRGHEGQGEHIPDVRLASPVIVDRLGDPVDDRDDPDGGERPEEEGEVDQEVGVPRIIIIIIIIIIMVYQGCSP